MTDANALAASLAAVHGPRDINAIDLSNGQVMDWSVRTADGWSMDIGDGAGGSVVIDLSRDQMIALHNRLTLTLMSDL